MPQIRELSLDEMKYIYGEYMEKDFPRGELRPFSSIKKNYEEGNYKGYGYYEGKRFLAYACFYSYAGARESLLDYFAVVPELRGKGYGSEFLKGLTAKLPEGYSILIEAESVDGAEDDGERAEREKRISFYEKNGAVLTGVKCLLLSVDYEILLISGNDGKSSESGIDREDCYEMIKSLYRNLYKPIFSRFLKLYFS